MVSEKARINRMHTVVQLHKIPEKVKLETKTRLRVAWDWVGIGITANVLKLDCDYDCIML